jgi:hypothetical protein
MILVEHDGSGRRFVHTRWCRFGHPQIRNVGRIRVLAELDATGQLYLSARKLTGDEVTEDPHLVVAKLRGGIVRVPRGQVESLAQSYTAARTTTVADVSSPGGRATQAVSRVLAVAPTL